MVTVDFSPPTTWCPVPFVQKLRELIIAEIVKKGTVQLVVGDEKTTVTMV